MNGQLNNHAAVANVQFFGQEHATERSAAEFFDQLETENRFAHLRPIRRIVHKHAVGDVRAGENGDFKLLAKSRLERRIKASKEAGKQFFARFETANEFAM